MRSPGSQKKAGQNLLRAASVVRVRRDRKRLQGLPARHVLEGFYRQLGASPFLQSFQKRSVREDVTRGGGDTIFLAITFLRSRPTGKSFTLNIDLLDKPWSEVSYLQPPGTHLLLHYA